MAGGLIDEIFIALGVKVDSKDLDKLQKQFDKVLERAKNLGNNSKGGKGVDNLLKKFQSVSKVLPKGSSEFSKVSNILNKVGASSGLVAGGIIAIGAAVVGTTIALDKMAESFAKNYQFYTTFQRRTGINPGKIMGLTTTGSFLDMNVSEAQIANEIQNLQSRLTELSITGQGAMPFQLAGINPIGMNATDVIGALQDRFQGLSNPQQAYLADQLGLSSMLPILQMSRREYQAMAEYNKSLELTPDKLKALNEWGLELKKINKRWEYMGKLLTLSVSKPVMWLTKALTNFTEQLYSISTSILQIGKNIVNWLKPIQYILDTFRFMGAVIRDLWVMIEDLFGFLSGTKKSYLGQLVGADNPQDLLENMQNNVTNSIKDNIKTNHPLLNKALDAITNNNTQNNTFYNVKENENDKNLAWCNVFFNKEVV